MESLTLPSAVIAGMSMGYSDRRKDLRGFFFDGVKHRLMTTDGEMMLLYRLPTAFRMRYCVDASLAASIVPGDIELDFRDHGVIRNDERIPYMDDHEMWDRLDYALPNTKPTREPAQFDLQEYGELCAAVARGKTDEAVDAIGDMTVVLTILAAQLGTSIEVCQDAAWEQIKDRKGRMVHGVFVKEGDRD